MDFPYSQTLKIYKLVSTFTGERQEESVPTTLRKKQDREKHQGGKLAQKGGGALRWSGARQPG